MMVAVEKSLQITLASGMKTTINITTSNIHCFWSLLHYLHYFWNILAMLTLTLGYLTSPSRFYGSTGNPTLLACAGDQLVLTCTHNMVSNQASRWNFIPTFPSCTRRIVNHNNPTMVTPCGPFTFLNVTGVDESPTELSSTAIATADESLSNTVIECYDSERNSANSVGRITMCVIGTYFQVYVVATVTFS